MGTEGYRIWQGFARTLIDEDTKNLVEMKPDEFQSAQGLQQKGIILGEYKVLNGFAKLVESGLIAEEKLREMDRKVAEEKDKPAATRI